MLGHRELSLDEYFEIARRRIWLLVIPIVVAPVIAYLGARLLPARYSSQTMVLIEQPKVPDSFVKPVVTEELSQRLATIREQILSRARLQPIIERFGLYKKEIGKVPMEVLVESMRKKVEVTPVRADVASKAGGLPGFHIAFTADDPKVAQQVCGEISSMFLEENLRVREQRSQGTTDFLSEQLDQAKRDLDEQDAKLAAFKRRYMGQLPGQEQTNLSMLTSLTSQLDAVTQAISRAEQDKSYSEALLSDKLARLQPAQGNSSTATPQQLEQQLATRQSALLDLESRYTSDHPDVIKAKAEIAQLRDKLNQAASSVDTAEPEPRKAAEPPEIQQMRLQIHSTEQTIAQNKAQQAQLQKNIRTYEARLQLSPVVEEQFKALTRDYQTAATFYNELLTKKTQSEMATDLERRQQGEQFRIVDPPNLPEAPVFPNKLMFAGGGLAAGLGIGLGLVVIGEFRDKSIRSRRDVEFWLKLRVLGTVPSLTTSGDKDTGSHLDHGKRALKEA